MTAADEVFFKSLENMSHPELCQLVISQQKMIFEMHTREEANARINTEVHIQFMELQEKYNALQEEHAQLKVLLQKETDKNTLKTRSTFGRKTEKFMDLVSSANSKASDFEDETQIEDGETPPPKKVIAFPPKTDKGESSKKGGKRSPKTTSSKRSSLKDSIKNLPREIVYRYDEKALDDKYGKGNWRIAFWKSYETIEKIPVVYYVKEVRTPVVSVGLEHDLCSEPYDDKMLPHSYISPSMLADIIYRKFCLGLPFYRQAMDYCMGGLKLSRQDLIHWVNKLTPDLLDPVCAHMTDLLIHYRYVQCDETYIQVNKDGKAPGRKGYIWVHVSSEHLNCPPIVIFCYEPTRNTDHLRRFFGEFLGYITSDAYISYQVLENENESIVVTGCLMHCRRYFAEAFFLNDVSSMTEEDLATLPETKCLLMIRDIYMEEEKLKGLSPEKRTSARQMYVKPKVDKFFEYVQELLASEETVFTDRMMKALTYASNQESHLRVFLKDGNIPIDNGKSERVIRSYSIGRANWLFADTIAGAIVNATIYSIVETAKANGANVRVYLQYLFEKMSERTIRMESQDPAFMDTLMPWSAEYKEYESAIIWQSFDAYRRMFPKPAKPRTPLRRPQILKKNTSDPSEPKSA